MWALPIVSSPQLFALAIRRLQGGMNSSWPSIGRVLCGGIGISP
jgi:hypothetical protein